MKKIWDAMIVGSGVSGSFFAKNLCEAGLKCLVVEAGSHFKTEDFPLHELDANSQCYWSGGIEFTDDMSVALIRPKLVGGGSVVNQALVERLGEPILEEWKTHSNVDFFSSQKMGDFYDVAEKEIVIQSVPEAHWNENVHLFKRGFENCGYQYGVLRRAQKACPYDEGHDCIVCLTGCPHGSKQSMLVTTLQKAFKTGLTLIPNFEVETIQLKNGHFEVFGVDRLKGKETYLTEKLILAAGAIGNTKILLQSGMKENLPLLGEKFFTHPQRMVFAKYNKEIMSFKGGFQALKSEDASFRKQGFKLENVFTPPVALSMMLPGYGRGHQQKMKSIRSLACMEVAIRDTSQGSIRLKDGALQINKRMNKEDKRRLKLGLNAIYNVFKSTQATEIIDSQFEIGLHLMGGCSLGTSPENSVVDPNFNVHGFPNLWISDSSVFPSAPGINPSLTIMALSSMASAQFLKEAHCALKAS